MTRRCRSAAGNPTISGFTGFVYRTDNQNADPSMNHTTDIIDPDTGRRVISNEDVMVEETESGVRFTFKNMSKFRKANGQYYNFYTVDYFLIPNGVEALAEIERKVLEKNKILENGPPPPDVVLETVPIKNTAFFRDDQSTATAYLSHKNDILPVTKRCEPYDPETSTYGQMHPKYGFLLALLHLDRYEMYPLREHCRKAPQSISPTRETASIVWRSRVWTNTRPTANCGSISLLKANSKDSRRSMRTNRTAS